MKGKHFSVDHKRKLSEALKGISKSDKTRQKMSEAHKGVPLSERHKKRLWGRTPWNKGKHGIFSEEARRKMREARLNQVLTTKDSSIEVKMQNELQRRGIAFQTHIPLCGICQPDIVIPEKRVVIQCDGDYWHNFPHGLIRDRNQDKTLRIYGWKVYRFWEHEINKDASACINQVIVGLVSCPLAEQKNGR